MIRWIPTWICNQSRSSQSRDKTNPHGKSLVNFSPIIDRFSVFFFLFFNWHDCDIIGSYPRSWYTLFVLMWPVTSGLIHVHLDVASVLSNLRLSWLPVSGLLIFWDSRLGLTTRFLSWPRILSKVLWTFLELASSIVMAPYLTSFWNESNRRILIIQNTKFNRRIILNILQSTLCS